MLKLKLEVKLTLIVLEASQSRKMIDQSTSGLVSCLFNSTDLVRTNI